MSDSVARFLDVDRDLLSSREDRDNSPMVPLSVRPFASVRSTVSPVLTTVGTSAKDVTTVWAPAVSGSRITAAATHIDRMIYGIGP